MSMYFCLTVRFLQPYFHGRADGAEPEWPPSPLRLFQAITAAAANRWREAQFHDQPVPALQWLEKLPTPVVIASVGQPAEPKYRLYVPDNMFDKVAKSWCSGREASIADYRTEKDMHRYASKGRQSTICFHSPTLVAHTLNYFPPPLAPSPTWVGGSTWLPRTHRPLLKKKPRNFLGSIGVQFTAHRPADTVCRLQGP